jgi:hypothetical protein
MFKPKLISRFQEAAIFLGSFYDILKKDHIRPRPEAMFKRTANAEDNFHSFLNRIAELLDSRPKGKTVTAVLIQDAYGEYVYWIASNERTETHINVTKMFLEDLLKRVMHVKSTDASDSERKLAEIFRRVLRFNRAKLTGYMNLLSEKLGEVLTSGHAAARTPRDRKSSSRIL